MELELNRTAEGVCPIVVVVLGRRGTGKTKLMEAAAPLFAERQKLVIVSPIPTLKTRMPDVPWYKVTVNNKDGIEKLFRGWLNDPAHRFILADEADELTAANAAGTAGGFVTQACYDIINYGREQGLGMCLSSRRPSNIAKDITANANLVFVANTTDPYALDYYRAWMSDPTRPDIDFREKCQVLPTIETYGYSVFMVWEPGRKFLGYVTVDMDRNELREWDPSELDDSKKASVLDASSTGPSTTTDTSGSDGTSVSATGSDAPSAASASPIGPGASTARTTGAS